jgi:hypothetical protein
VRLLLAVIVMGAVEDEGTFWIQLLMMVMLAAGAGIYLLFKSRAKRAEQQTHDEVIETIIETPMVPALSKVEGSFASPEPGRRVEPPKYLAKSAPLHASPENRRIEWPTASEIKPRRKNLTSGMELLARNFLVSVVEQTDSPNQRDIEMRRLCFTELGRRGELWSIASTALKIYTLDEDGFYGKVIRFEAMAELAGRTVKEPHNVAEINPASSLEKEPAAHNAR